jgi:hypothetical protein
LNLFAEKYLDDSEAGSGGSGGGTEVVLASWDGGEDVNELLLLLGLLLLLALLLLFSFSVSTLDVFWFELLVSANSSFEKII